MEAKPDKPSAALSAGLVDRLSRGRVLIVGDLILDRHVSGLVRRVRPEAPVQILEVERRESSPGGAANVACKIAELEGNAVLAGVVGADAEGDELVALTEAFGVDCSGVVRCARPTTTKTRYLARGQQLLRVDDETQVPVAAETEIELAEAVATEVARLSAADAVVVEDYGKGTLAPKVLAAALERAGEIPVVVDPCGSDWSRYRSAGKGASVITPNALELGVAAHMPVGTEDEIARAAAACLDESGAGAIAVTRGRDGITLATRAESGAEVAIEHVPTVPVEVSDVTGAGDAVAAAFALALAGGMSMNEAARLANLAGGAVVRQLGVGRISRGELLRTAALDSGTAGHKVVSREEALREAARVRSAGGRVVFTNGCFDLLHRGHVSLLEQCARHGELVVVGLNSDASARRLKGPSRPLTPEAERALVLASLASVGLVVTFDEDTPERLIRDVSPDVLVKGADYAESEIVGADWVKSHGGEVVRAELVDVLSTSGILERARGNGSRA